MAPKNILIALAGGALVYGGVLAIGSFQGPTREATIAAAVTPTPSKIVTAKTGDKKVTVSVSPSMSPTLAPKVSVTPWPAVVTPTPSPSPTQTPAAVPTPWPTPTPTLPTPSPDVGATASPTPTSVGSARVVINEIAWMGTTTSSNDEWIELYNAGDGAADLTGWTLYEGSNTKIIDLSGSIAPGGYFLIERTNESTISDISADAFGPFGGSGLKNGPPGERLTVRDAMGAIVDEVDCSVGEWFAGDNAAKASMERKSPLAPGNDPQNWATNNGIIMVGADADGLAIHGTPKYANSVGTP